MSWLTDSPTPPPHQSVVTGTAPELVKWYSIHFYENKALSNDVLKDISSSFRCLGEGIFSKILKPWTFIEGNNKLIP